VACAALPRQRRHAYHEKLVEVICGDGEKLDALQQGMDVQPSLRQDPFVEREPAQFPIDIEGAIARFHNDGRS
jgi:hypothetical protein